MLEKLAEDKKRLEKAARDRAIAQKKLEEDVDEEG